MGFTRRDRDGDSGEDLAKQRQWCRDCAVPGRHRREISPATIELNAPIYRLTVASVTEAWPSIVTIRGRVTPIARAMSEAVAPADSRRARRPAPVIAAATSSAVVIRCGRDMSWRTLNQMEPVESGYRALSAYQSDDLERHRAWLAAMIAEARRLEEHGSTARLPVHASYAASFFPVFGVAADGSQRHLAIAEDLARLVVGDRPVIPAGADGGRLAVSADGGGAFLRFRSRTTDGEITRDPRRIADLVGATGGYRDWIEPVIAAPPAAADAARRRGPATHTLVEAFIFWALRGTLGTIAAARQILAWEAELDAPWSRATAGALAGRFIAGERLTPLERRSLRGAERAIVTSARRARPALGRLDPS